MRRPFFNIYGQVALKAHGKNTDQRCRGYLLNIAWELFFKCRICVIG